MKIKTTELVRLISNVVKASGNNKIIPITQMLGFKLQDKALVVSATDSFNYLYAIKKLSDEESQNDDINVCINADTFYKLISKFTSEFTTITLKDKYLQVTGNGEYKLDLLLTDDGLPYNFTVKNVPEGANRQDIDLVKFTTLKSYAEKSLAQTMEEPDLIAYFVNDEFGISTDRNIMTLYKESITNIPLTLRSKFVELISLMKEKIELYTWNNEVTKELNVAATDGEIIVFSKINAPVEDYPYEAIKNLIDNSEFTVSGKISVKELNSILERISLMVTPYDSNVIKLQLDNSTLYISSFKSTGLESLSLKDISSNTSWQGDIDIEMLKGQLSSFNKEEIEIHLGNDNCIKLTESNVTKLVCLVEQ